MQLNELKEQDVELNAYISQWYFDAIITAVKSLGGYHQNEEYRSVFEAPSLALSLGHSINLIAAELHRRFRPTETETGSSVPVLAALLDPFFKDLDISCRLRNFTRQKRL
ncbi:hypothetical protein DPMN_023365 [Dreissena polymorpha]|uniref:Uncharacterized protein n=1 Tax=Dreissena polymorpha TaxID=45954 RepID=A0A9D4LKL2_DREPO|nr:hypothetical protein DPMN_023365 [Dreissena polymorpha]